MIEEQIEEHPIEAAGRPMVRVQQGDWNQCQSRSTTFQCPYRATGTRIKDPSDPTRTIWEGSPYCPRHSGGNREDKANLRQYNVAKFKDSMRRFADHPEAKSLREDLAILKMTLESRLEGMKDATDLSIRSGGTIELVREIAKTTLALHKIERESGELLDKTQILVFMKQVVDIIAENITDQNQLTAIANDIAMSMERLFHKS